MVDREVWDDYQTSTKSEWSEETSYPQVRVSLVLHHKQRIQIIPLEEGRPVEVGRGREVDVKLSDGLLSRRHARFELIHGEVFVEDLKSTNGTELNGRSIGRERVNSGDRVSMGGAVAASIHILRPTSLGLPGVLTHEDFLELLAGELQQAKRRDTTLAALMARATGPHGGTDAWYQEIRHLLGAKDRLAIHSPDVVELLLPRCTRERARRVAETIVTGGDGEPAAICGVALYPETGIDSAEGMFEVMRNALQQASTAVPVSWATASGALDVVQQRDDLVPTPTMQALYGTIRKLARAAIPVLVFGETGTGKEVVARALHQQSKRSGPMLCINCGAIPQSLIESELFGHERGAFTGADRLAKGVFEEADGGTVLLDEVGELSPAAQAALLRVLETKAITRVGSNRPVPVDVRIIAATHRDLEAMCEEGTFRLDLLHRLNTMTLTVPPLRERHREVEALAGHFLAQANRANGCRVRGISPEVMTLLNQYQWPGNVRELRNVIDHATVVADSGVIGVAHLPDRILAGATCSRAYVESIDTREDHQRLGAPEVIYDEREDAGPDTVVRQMPERPDFKHHVRRVESALIGAALAGCGWNKAEAARRLEIPLRTLKEKVRQSEIVERRFDADEAAHLIDVFERTVARWDEPATPGESFKDRVRRYEAVLLLDSLRASGGNKAEAARRLLIPLRTLKEKVRVYDLDRRL